MIILSNDSYCKNSFFRKLFSFSKISKEKRQKFWLMLIENLSIINDFILLFFSLCQYVLRWTKFKNKLTKFIIKVLNYVLTLLKNKYIQVIWNSNYCWRKSIERIHICSILIYNIVRKNPIYSCFATYF
jgi:hypothetical protein